MAAKVRQAEMRRHPGPFAEEPGFFRARGGAQVGYGLTLAPVREMPAPPP